MTTNTMKIIPYYKKKLKRFKEDIYMFAMYLCFKKNKNLQVCPLAIMRPVVDKSRSKAQCKKIRNKDKEQKYLRINLLK